MRYLLVGAGTFGASTALHLKQAHHESEVTLIDRTSFPCSSAAGHDLNKVVRAEYEDTLYMELALEAIQEWKTSPLFKQYYHETGILFAGVPEPGLKIVENFNEVLGRSPATILDPAVAKERFGGVFRRGDWTGVTSCTWNPEAGWADAEEALRAIIQEAVDIGVRYQTQAVAKLLFDHDGRCTGVSTMDGEQILADKVILCTGANTAELLADSAPDRAELQVGDKLIAAAAIMCLFRVPEVDMEKFASAPVIVNLTGSMGVESIPPGVKGLCKCTHELSFTNCTYHEASKQKISIPPKLVSRMTWSHDVPQGLREEVHAATKKLYGSWFDDVQPETYRMCWDAVTPNQDWVICPHPAVQGLYVASGGSFHGWKFLPIICKYITQMIDGNLDERKASRWAWDRPNDGANCAMYLPSRDLKDIKGYMPASE